MRQRRPCSGLGRTALAVLACLVLMPGAGLTTPYSISDPEQRAATARAIAERLAESRERAGADSRAYADAISVSLEALLAIRRPEEAAVLAREAIGIYRATGERRGGLYMHAMDQLGDALLRLGRTGEAVEVLQEKLEIGRASNDGRGSFDYHTASRLYSLLERLGRYGEAEVLRREELEAIRSDGEGFWSYPRSEENLRKYFLRQSEPRLLGELAVLVEKQGRFDEARRLHAEAVEKSRLLFGNGSGATWKVVRAFGRFLAEHGEGPQDAAALAELKAAFPRLFPR